MSQRFGAGLQIDTISDCGGVAQMVRAWDS